MKIKMNMKIELNVNIESLDGVNSELHNIFNLSEDFREKLSKLHKKGQCPCKVSGRYLGIDPDALVDAMSWMQENDIPPCIWAFGGVLHELPDGFLLEKIYQRRLLWSWLILYILILYICLILIKWK